MLEFKSFNSESNISFKTKYTLKDNTYSFNDLSSDNTLIDLKVISKTCVKFKRTGSINMNVDFALDKKTVIEYENSLGKMTNLYALTKNIKISDKNIYVKYEIYLDNECLDTHKIWIIIKN